MVGKMEARRLPEHLATELIWGFVNSTKEPMAELTTTPPTTDWVSESPALDSGQFWGRVWGIGDQPSTSSDNVVTTVSPTIDLVKDLVTEHIEKVKVTWWETTNIVTDQIEEVTTLSKEQIVVATGADETSFSTTTTTTISTTTPTTRGVEVTKDYRVLPGEVGLSIEDLHWSYYLLIGFACLALLVCLAQGFTCLYISLARQNNSSRLKEVVVCRKTEKRSLSS